MRTLALMVVVVQVALSGAAAGPPAKPAKKAVISNAGSHEIRFRPLDGPVPLNEPFSLEVEVRARGRRRAPKDVALRFDAVMPEHRHGMNVEPVVHSLGRGRFRVEGVLLHMPGRWQFHFDVTRGALTERAQLDHVLE